MGESKGVDEALLVDGAGDANGDTDEEHLVGGGPLPVEERVDGGDDHCLKHVIEANLLSGVTSFGEAAHCNNGKGDKESAKKGNGRVKFDEARSFGLQDKDDADET